MMSSLQGDKKEVNYEEVSSGLDLEFQAEGNTIAPEPASYETAYVTSHKHACRSGSFSFDGQLVATGNFWCMASHSKLYEGLLFFRKC